jgi:exopolysaccharide biosynthesis protein
MYGLPLRTGFTMKIKGIILNRRDMHDIAAELGVTENDVLIKDGILTVYNTSKTCQEIVDDNALATFVAMVIEIPVEDISELTEVVEKKVKMEFDLSDFEDDD